MSNRLYVGSEFVGGPGVPAIISSSTASSSASVTINEDIFIIYKFTGSGNIAISSPGFVDVLVQGGGGLGNISEAVGENTWGAGGGGGQVERLNIYVPSGTHSVRVGSGTGSGLALSNPSGTSSFLGIIAVGGAPASQFRDRPPGGGACGASSANEYILFDSLGLDGQGRIGENLRGGNANGRNTPGGGIGSDTGNGYDPGEIWGSPGELGCGGNASKPMSANTGNGGNNGSPGNSGLVLIRVKQ
jgi:hypothetical protein